MVGPHQMMIQAIPLTPHAAASTDRNADPFVESKERGGRSWTAFLKEVPHDNYLGLRFYHQDPLPFLLDATSADRALFDDDEFPVHSKVLVSTTPNKQVAMQPGLITSSNCRDLARGERRQRIGQFCRLATHYCWKRKGSSYPLFLEINANNVVQGAIGNCGFCSGFASLADLSPSFIREAFGRYSQEALVRCGAYSVRLYPQGKERYLLLDDYLLCDDEKDKPPSIRSRRGDVWAEYLEKVIVKIQGSYASLDGHYKFNSLYRHPVRALQLLTGAPIALEVHYDKTHQVDEIYDTLMASQGGAYARVVHCRQKLLGLRSNHGYSLLYVGSVKGQRFVCLRNPHGRASYTGKFGCGWPGWGTEAGSAISKELIRLGCFERCSHTGQPLWCGREEKRSSGSLRGRPNDSGIFLMEFSVFVECFPITSLVGPIVGKSSNSGTGIATNESTAPDCVYRSQPGQLSSIKFLLKS